MTGPTEGLYKNVTLNDVQLASAYYPILIEMAMHKHCLAYSELVAQAKARYPARTVIQRAIAVSTGRKLDVVRIFTAERGLPDLTSLVINKDLGDCGSLFTRHFDSASVRAQVFAYDWSNVTQDFDGYVRQAEAIVTPRKRRREAEARQLLHEFYSVNRTLLPDTVRQRRELIIELLIEGFPPEDAFAQACASDV